MTTGLTSESKLGGGAESARRTIERLDSSVLVGCGSRFPSTGGDIPEESTYIPSRRSRQASEQGSIHAGHRVPEGNLMPQVKKTEL